MEKRRSYENLKQSAHNCLFNRSTSCYIVHISLLIRAGSEGSCEEGTRNSSEDREGTGRPPADRRLLPAGSSDSAAECQATLRPCCHLSRAAPVCGDGVQAWKQLWTGVESLQEVCRVGFGTSQGSRRADPASRRHGESGSTETAVSH